MTIEASRTFVRRVRSRTNQLPQVEEVAEKLNSAVILSEAKNLSWIYA
jgi:hypothetical protein